MRAFSLVDPANPMRVVDLLLKPEVPFGDLLVRSQEVMLGTTKIRIASIDDLIALETASRTATRLDGHRAAGSDPTTKRSPLTWPLSRLFPRMRHGKPTGMLMTKACLLRHCPPRRLNGLPGSEEALRVACASGALKWRMPAQGE